MAELILQVGADDGDVLCAFTDRRIRDVHAQHIGQPGYVGFNSDGLRPVDCLCERILQKRYQYKFVRVSAKEVKRIDLVSGLSVVFSDQPIEVDGKKQAIDVDAFVKHRLKMKDRRAFNLFGTIGREIWYGGKWSADDAAINTCWHTIQTHSDHRDQNECPHCSDDHHLWCCGRLDIRHFLGVRTTDLTDAEAADLVAPDEEELDVSSNIRGPNNEIVELEPNETKEFEKHENNGKKLRWTFTREGDKIRANYGKRRWKWDWLKHGLHARLHVTPAAVRDRVVPIGRELDIEWREVYQQGKRYTTKEHEPVDRNGIERKTNGRQMRRFV